jgi:transcriptional regulator with XRE-family HTH domain
MTMKFNTDRKWLERRAEQEDRHFISVGGLISTLDPTCQAEISSVPNVETTKTAFVRLLQLARRERRLSLEQLAEKADVDLAELLKIETDETFTPALRTVHQLAAVLDLPAKKLMVLAGLLQIKDPSLQQASVRFAARSEPAGDVSPEEHAALEEYVKFLNER